jgi:predicted Zn-dependent peptidase
MAKHFLHYGKERSLDELIAQIDAITASQLQDVAQRLFAPEHMQQLIL